MSDDIIKQLETMWLAQEPKLLWGDMQAVTDLAAFEIERLRAENEKLRAALAAIVHSVQVAQSMGCVSGWDFALTLPRAKVALSDSKSDN